MNSSAHPGRDETSQVIMSQCLSFALGFGAPLSLHPQLPSHVVDFAITVNGRLRHAVEEKYYILVLCPATPHHTTPHHPFHRPCRSTAGTSKPTPCISGSRDHPCHTAGITSLNSAKAGSFG